MIVEFESAEARGLRRYARLVERALGLGAGGHYVQLERPASIYLPLLDRLMRFPDQDVALIWDEQRGWAVGLDNAAGEEIAVVACLTDDVLPKPFVVAAFVDQVFAGECPGEPESRIFRAAADVDDLALRLTSYAQPEYVRPVTTLQAEQFDAH